MYKGEWNNTLAKSNSHTTADLVFPNIFCPAFTESINNSPLKQTLCDDNLDHSLEWLRHSAREQEPNDVGKGISLSPSLSPLVAAIFLIPLDKVISKILHFSIDVTRTIGLLFSKSDDSYAK